MYVCMYAVLVAMCIPKIEDRGIQCYVPKGKPKEPCN